MKTSMKLSLVTCLFLVAACGSTTETRWVDGSSNGDDGSGTGDDGSGQNPDGTNPGSTGMPGSSNPNTPPPPIVTGLSVSKIAVFQGVEVDVLKTGGTWVAPNQRNAPLVANRPALFRIYVTPDASWTASSVTAEIRLQSGSMKFPIVSKTMTVSKASTDADTSSTFNLEVPADSLPTDAQFVINLSGGTKSSMPTGSVPGRYPNDGNPTSLGLQPSGVVKVTVVPVKYMADGSGRLPDTSSTQLDLYKSTMMARYPATDVQITVRAPWSYSGSLSGGGNGIQSLLNSATNLRQSDGAAPDEYYYVAFASATSFDNYCASSCITGLSSVVDEPSVSQLRVSVGIGFTGDESAITMAHEVGHAHGRNHAPCGGAQGIDPQFPYSTGGIGVMGYDIIGKSFVSASTGKDMMGYCSPEWVSDYTFSALFDRVSAVNTMYGGGTPGKSMAYRVASVDEVGNIEWIGGVEYLDHEPIGGQTRTATFASETGVQLATQTAKFYPFDHLKGGTMLVPVSATSWSHVKFDGVDARLAR